MRKIHLAFWMTLATVPAFACDALGPIFFLFCIVFPAPALGLRLGIRRNRKLAPRNRRFAANLLSLLICAAHYFVFFENGTFRLLYRHAGLEVGFLLTGILLPLLPYTLLGLLPGQPELEERIAL